MRPGPPAARSARPQNARTGAPAARQLQTPGQGIVAGEVSSWPCHAPLSDIENGIKSQEPPQGSANLHLLCICGPESVAIAKNREASFHHAAQATSWLHEGIGQLRCDILGGERGRISR